MEIIDYYLLTCILFIKRDYKENHTFKCTMYDFYLNDYFIIKAGLKLGKDYRSIVYI